MRQRRTGKDMNNCNPLSKSGPAKVLLFAGMLVLASGCVHEHVTHVTESYPVAVQAPVPAPSAPVVIPPPPPIEFPPAPPPAPLVPIRSAADLDRMLAPIALYPDPLLAQILPAATLPEQVVLADRYLREGGDMNLIDAQPWDNSLKALARYPATLRMLDDNLAWTTDLGQAFLNQPGDVMDSVQRLRAQAGAIGNLQSTPQQNVVVSGGVIEILPPTPQVIYVPVYQPEVVYVQPPPAPGRFHISFGAGLVVGAWLNHDCDWHHHDVIVWHHDHPRPADWWEGPPTRRETPTVVNNVTVVNNTTIVNQNFTVWHPQTRGATVDRGDRGWAQTNVPTSVAPARNEAAQPHQAPIVAEAQTPVASREIRSTAPMKEPRPSQSGVQPAPARPPQAGASAHREEARPAPVTASRGSAAVAQRPTVQPAPVSARQPRTVNPAVAQTQAPVTPRSSDGQQLPAREVTSVGRPNPPVTAPKDPRPAAPVSARQPSPGASVARPAAPPVTSRPVATAPVQVRSSALAGVESSQAARQASVRGQQSREAIAKPAAAPRPAAKAPSPRANPPESKRPQQARPN